MKKTILFVLAAVAVFVSSQAQVVNEQQALQQASQFFQKMDAESRQPARHHGALKRSMPRSVESTAENGDAPAYYIFNRGEDGGFVIVSGDMRTSHSILGYSSKGTLKTENAPANVLAWLNGYAAEIRAIQKHNTGIEGGTGWQEAVGNVVEGTQLMGHGVAHAEEGVGKCHTCHGSGVCHLLSCLNICLSILVSSGKIFKNSLQSLNCKTICIACSHYGSISFKSVCYCIDTGCCCKALRSAHVVVCIYYSHIWQ